MKRLLFILLFNIVCIFCVSQNIEKYNFVIDMRYYKAYYSKEIQTSSFVIYKLYKGGGDISRKGLSFKPYKNLPYFTYTHSGYDRGHLVPAEDMAYSKQSLQSTFYYINCIPQNPTFNRSTWRVYENDIRVRSQVDSLLIICGGCDYPDGSLIPKNCFKIVYNLRTGRCIYSLLFSNSKEIIITNEPKLKQKIPFKKAIELYSH